MIKQVHSQTPRSKRDLRDLDDLLNSALDSSRESPYHDQLSGFSNPIHLSQDQLSQAPASTELSISQANNSIQPIQIIPPVINQLRATPSSTAAKADAILGSSLYNDGTDSLTGLSVASTWVGRSRPNRTRRRVRASSLYSAQSGYGLVNAAAAVGAATRTVIPKVADLGGNSWGLDQINAPEVWAKGDTGKGVVVAVVDSGVDYTHPDLDANIWSNPGEIAGNGIDDDGDGFVDDIHGWDFVTNSNAPLDPDGHGTHVAGIIAAENNGVGTTGVAPNAKIMPVRVLDASGNGDLNTVAAGIRYAANNGADVINLSLGGEYFSPELTNAVQYAESRGAVVVMAAGNSGGAVPDSPARLARQQGIAVGAVNRSRQLASFSNRSGRTPLNYVAAPGVGITSTIPNNSYASYSGTSMATPFVSGVAALVLSANPTLAPNQVEALLTGSANHTGVIA